MPTLKKNKSGNEQTDRNKKHVLAGETEKSKPGKDKTEQVQIQTGTILE